MHYSQIYGCVCSLLVLTCVWAAPVSEKLTAMKKRSADQENQLKNLLSMAGNSMKLPNVAVQKSHVSHVESLNGQAVKHEEVEEKVTDKETGKVVSDIKQDVTESKKPGEEAHSVVETKIDIPAEGVHKTVVENDPKEDSENIEFTPTALAEFLLETGKFQEFDSAIKDLVNNSIMTSAEAESYQQEVMAEYQRLLAEIDAFQSELAQQESVPSYYPPPPAYPVDYPQKKSDVYGYQGGYLPMDLTSDNEQVVQEALINNQKSLGAAIDALLEAWWNQAFEAGDARAQALVEYLYSIVSKDNDMDDIGQIRSILAEMLARALMDDLSGADQLVPESSESREDSEEEENTSHQSSESAESQSSEDESSSEEGNTEDEENSDNAEQEDSHTPETEENKSANDSPKVDETAKM